MPGQNVQTGSDVIMKITVGLILALCLASLQAETERPTNFDSAEMERLLDGVARRGHQGDPRRRTARMAHAGERQALLISQITTGIEVKTVGEAASVRRVSSMT